MSGVCEQNLIPALWPCEVCGMPAVMFGYKDCSWKSFTGRCNDHPLNFEAATGGVTTTLLNWFQYKSEMERGVHKQPE